MSIEQRYIFLLVIFSTSNIVFTLNFLYFYLQIEQRKVQNHAEISIFFDSQENIAQLFGIFLIVSDVLERPIL